MDWPCSWEAMSTQWFLIWPRHFSNFRACILGSTYILVHFQSEAIGVEYISTQDYDLKRAQITLGSEIGWGSNLGNIDIWTKRWLSCPYGWYEILSFFLKVFRMFQHDLHYKSGWGCCEQLGSLCGSTICHKLTHYPPTFLFSFELLWFQGQ